MRATSAAAVGVKVKVKRRWSTPHAHTRKHSHTHTNTYENCARISPQLLAMYANQTRSKFGPGGGPGRGFGGRRSQRQSINGPGRRRASLVPMMS